MNTFKATDVVPTNEILDYEKISLKKFPLTKTKKNYGLPMLIEKAPSHAISVLKKQGLEPKVFCFANTANDSSNFEVAGHNWNWSVTPVTSKNIAQIPPHFIEATRFLLANEFPITSLALAKPKLIEAPIQVVRQELQKEVTTALRVCQACVDLILNATKILAEGFSNPPSIVTPVSSVQLADPVLLAKINDKWIEIGRWE